MSSTDDVFSGAGQRIAAARGIRKMSQAGLAEILGKTKLTIGRWERGITRIPELAWKNLSFALQVREEWLKTGEEPMLPSREERFKQMNESAEILNRQINQEIKFELRPPDLIGPYSIERLKTIINGMTVVETDIPAARRLAIYVINNCVFNIYENLSTIEDTQLQDIASLLLQELRRFLPYKE